MSTLCRFYRFAAVSALALAGCQSGVERDIVQREMRQQEDQIYALEDYISEYQQLLCDVRRENAVLKRQLVQGQFRDGEPVPSDARDLPSPPAAPPVRPSTAPETTVPDVPALDLDDPQVPTLDQSSVREAEDSYEPVAESIPESDDSESEVREDEAQYAAHEEPAAAKYAKPTRIIKYTAVEEPTESDASEPAGAVRLAAVEMESPPEAVPRPAAVVALRGEVSFDDAGSPRVLLDVEPLSESGESAEFHGSVSLLVLDPAADNDKKQLARWDFSPADLQQFANPTAGGTGFEFPLQLPGNVAADGPTELWVRLVSEDGDKLLNRTNVDLSRPGRFASAEAKLSRPPSPPHDSAVRTVAVESPVKRFSLDEPPSPEGILRSDWHIARPGESSPSPSPPAAFERESDWRAATQPIPQIAAVPLAESTPITTAYLPPQNGGDRYPTAAPKWVPDRKGGTQVLTPPIDHIVPPPGPNWAPNR